MAPIFLVNIVLDDGLLPVRRQAITWNIAELLWINLNRKLYTQENAFESVVCKR